MENPDQWDLLTASLAVSDLVDLSQTWAFLVLQGLVRDDGPARQQFDEIVLEVSAEGPITGPSEALRIASRIDRAGLALERSRRPDPMGRLALARRSIAVEWKASSSATG